MGRTLKIIITGFDVFDSLAYNPSKIIIKFINDYVINKNTENVNSAIETDECVNFFVNKCHCLKGVDKNYIFEDVTGIESEHSNNQNQQTESYTNLNHNNNDNHTNDCKNTKKKKKEIEDECQFIPVGKIEDYTAEEIKNHLTALARFFNVNCFEFIKSEYCSVNKEAVDELVQSIYEQWETESETKQKVGNETNCYSKDDVIVIHMGVYSLANSLTLESTGTNLLIVNPEENGKNPDDKNLSVEERIETTLAVQNICQQVNAEKNLNVHLSHDSGTYFCNYIYYRSLKLARNYSIPVLFIHLPLFETVQFHEQVITLRRILLCVYDELFCTGI